MRDGQEQEISPDELVLDDVVLFKSGEQISGDAIVLSGEVRVNESLLTGESDEITKVADSQLCQVALLCQVLVMQELIKLALRPMFIN